MNGEITIGEGAYHFEAGRSKPNPRREGQVTFDDCIHIWFKNKSHAIDSIENLLRQIKDERTDRDISLTFCGELKFEKEE